MYTGALFIEFMPMWSFVMLSDRKQNEKALDIGSYYMCMHT